MDTLEADIRAYTVLRTVSCSEEKEKLRLIGV